MFAVAGRSRAGGQNGSDDGQAVSEPLQDVIERIQCQGRFHGEPCRSYGQPFKPVAHRLPEQSCRQGMPRQRPCEHDRKRPTATAPPAAIAAEHPVASGNASFVCSRIVTVHAAVPVERADPFTERARHALERAKELLKTFDIGYKNHMSWFFHGRNIDDLDGLSNAACDAIRARKWDEAEKHCRRLRELYPDEVDADDRLAQLRVAQNDFAGALPYARAALNMARNYPDKFDPELVTDLAEQVDFIEKEAVK